MGDENITTPLSFSKTERVSERAFSFIATPAESNAVEFIGMLVKSLRIKFPNRNKARDAITAIMITVPVAAKIFFTDMDSSLSGWIPEGIHNDLCKCPKMQIPELGRICLKPCLSLWIPILLRQLIDPKPLSPS